MNSLQLICETRCGGVWSSFRLGGSLVYVLVASASRYFFNSDYGMVASFLNQ